MIPPIHAQRLAAILVACAALGCSSTDASAPPKAGAPTRIRVLSYTSGRSFELVNESHTSRVDLYSQTRASADTKVQTDEVVAAMLDYFEEQGFYRDAEPGLAPAATEGATRAIEIDTPGRPVHMVVGAGTPKERLAVFDSCFTGFLQVYNATFQLQSVEGQPEWNTAPKKSAATGGRRP